MQNNVIKIVGLALMASFLLIVSPSETRASGTVTAGDCQLRAYTTSPRGTMVFYHNCPAVWFPAEH